jgi:hypothetical protein
VAPCERTLRGIQHGVDADQGDLGAQEPSPLDREVDSAPGVDRPKDGRMAGGDFGLTTKMLAANIDEVGVGGERGSERGAVHGVPGNLKLADNILECGSVGWGQIGGQVLPLGKGFGWL